MILTAVSPQPGSPQGMLIAPPVYDPLTLKPLAVLHKLALAYAAEKQPTATSTELIAQETLVTLSLLEPQRASLAMLSERLSIHRFQLHEALLRLIEQRLVQLKGQDFRLTPKGLTQAIAHQTMVHAVIRKVSQFDQDMTDEIHRVSLRLIRSKQLAHSIKPSQLCVACTWFQPFAYTGNSAPHHCALTAERFAGPPLIQITKRTVATTNTKPRRPSA
ncbi:MAG: hypothetical protein KGS09_17195 [Nitrospirae bacterium]|nr:hypothetical protein [Nitrospirota bacterium]MBU6482265.1 hypothetical protein [Nitrospirota bacterium]MDE3039006.1 hypothetical protein [Nitrospirota bacterium]MDE3050199.1 hypothetical protein [Nitrospirota bacterium]MDE3220987.1 hypothetical protein [Nitrospirota bacterium]